MLNFKGEKPKVRNSTKVGTFCKLYFLLSVTRLGDFYKFFVSNFLFKGAQLYGDSLGFLKTSIFKWKLRWLLFSQLLGKNWANFHFNIWSHCSSFAPLSSWPPKPSTVWPDVLLFWRLLKLLAINCWEKVAQIFSEAFGQFLKKIFLR